MIKIKRSILISALLIGIFSLCSCVPWWVDLYYNYDCIWYSENPYIEFNVHTNYGEMTIDEINYSIDAAYEPDGSELDVYNIGDSDVDDVLFIGSTYVEDGELYFTITEDNISDLLGTTIVFVQHDIEDDTTTS